MIDAKSNCCYTNTIKDSILSLCTVYQEINEIKKNVVPPT